MRQWLVLGMVLALGTVTGARAASDWTPFVTGATLDVKDGALTIAVQRAGVGTAVALEGFKVSVPYRPSGAYVMSPVTAVLDLSMQQTELSIARIALNVKPLEDAGVALPGGFIASLIKAHLEAFDTREIAMSIRAGKVSLAAKSGFVHTKFEGALGWGEGTQLAFRVDSIKVNFGVPIPRPMIMKRLAWLDPLDWADVKENVVLIDVAKLANLAATSLPKALHLDLPALSH